MKTKQNEENNDSTTKVLKKIPIFKVMGTHYFDLPKGILTVEMCFSVKNKEILKQYVLTLFGKKVWWDGKNEEQITTFLSAGFNDDLDPTSKEEYEEFKSAIRKIY